jgi:predicted GH43/DUF377 family glycosyl hydrolase
MFYIGGALQGYETDPLAIGVAWSKTPTEAREWTSLAENPVLSRAQPDVREFEKVTLYKSQIIWDNARTLVHFFVMFYNGKCKTGERIGMAVSDDLVHWTKWTGPHLVESSESCDKAYAHKPWVIKHDGVVYHFYCAVGDQGRVIALATSKEFPH